MRLLIQTLQEARDLIACNCGTPCEGTCTFSKINTLLSKEHVLTELYQVVADFADYYESDSDLDNGLQELVTRAKRVIRLSETLTCGVMSHEEFIELAKNKGLNVKRITRNRVYLSSDDDIHSGIIYPSDWDTKTKQLASKLNLNAMIAGEPNLTLADIVGKHNMKIPAIKVIRAQTGIGLKEAKDLYELNWEKI